MLRGLISDVAKADDVNEAGRDVYDRFAEGFKTTNLKLARASSGFAIAVLTVGGSPRVRRIEAMPVAR